MDELYASDPISDADLRYARRWTNVINAGLDQARQAEERWDAACVACVIAKKLGHAKVEAKYLSTARHLEETYSVVEGYVKTWTGCATLDAAQQLVLDVRARMTSAYKLQEAWRKLAASVELLDASGAWTDGPEGVTRDRGMDAVRKAKAEFELQVALLRGRIPEGVVDAGLGN